jgi:hypothetical protein
MVDSSKVKIQNDLQEAHQVHVTKFYVTQDPSLLKA